MKQLKIGIAGLGISGTGTSRGTQIYKEFIKFPEVAVTAVMDPNPEALDLFTNQYDVDHAVKLYEELLMKDIDVVFISSPMQFHAPQAIQALKKNIHVLSEVTAAQSLKECQELLIAAKESEAQYMMAENYCFIRDNVAIKNMVKAGLFGEVYFAEGEYLHSVRDLHYHEGQPTWRKEYQVGKRGMTYGTHCLGPLLDWFEEPIDRVNCVGTGIHTYKEYQTDDTTLLECKLKSGKLLKLRLDMVSKRPHNMAYYSLQGTKGCYEGPKHKGDYHKVWLEDFCKDTEEWLDLSEFYERYLPEEMVHLPEEAKGSFHWGADYFMIKSFIHSIVKGIPVPVDIHKSLAMTIPGIISEQSIKDGGNFKKIPELNKQVEELQ
ncbi:glycosyl hydrolase family 109 protein 2 [Thalassobacillus devorans]|uniref:Glycosyl hydrolase family 109 protein 2 n=1 Tax=Thalassobacillus devorans TaxID=279813 RepID=A0ABQ1P1Y1_9BACI|nr:Gfo/Idh/MocA family oxidoreductase [Thalassobacillus devorans]NIK28016.1 putative dehydrogenase [Thalassobacillus devorans]GGC89570.1 glycosyl hydrolase family 109 protein 2 [Thalassobacillus devorans]